MNSLWLQTVLFFIVSVAVSSSSWYYNTPIQRRQSFSNIVKLSDTPQTTTTPSTFVPKPFVITASLGVKGDTKGYIKEKPKDNIYNFVKAPKPSESYNVTPKINYFSMNCFSGRKCSAIIQPPTTTVKPKVYTKKQRSAMREILRKYGMDYGFNYSRDPKKNEKNVITRSLGDPQNGSQRKSRDLNTDSWPGSQFRPASSGRAAQLPFSSPMYSHGVRHVLDTRTISKRSWRDVVSADVNRPGFQVPPRLPKPSSLKIRSYPYYNSQNNPHRTYSSKWQKVGTAKISKYDSKKQDWVPISSSNNGHRFSVNRPGANKGNTHYSSVRVTVQRPPKRPIHFQSPIVQPASFSSTAKNVSFSLDVLAPEADQVISSTINGEGSDSNSTSTGSESVTSESPVQVDTKQTTTNAPETLVFRPTIIQTPSSSNRISSRYNRFAVMAAAGASLLPVALAAVIPVAAGRRKRSYTLDDPISSQVPSSISLNTFDGEWRRGIVALNRK